MKAQTYEPYGQEVLELFGADAGTLLGQGKSSTVYSVDSLNVVRLYRPGTPREYAERMIAVLAAIDDSEFDYKIPKISYLETYKDLLFSVEERLGIDLERRLDDLTDEQAKPIIEQYVRSVGEFKNLKLDTSQLGFGPYEKFGEINGIDPIRRASWSEFLIDRTNENLEIAGPFLAADCPDLDRLMSVWMTSVAELPDPEPLMVHSDWGLVNVTLDQNDNLEAVIDFHEGAIIGDWMMDVAQAYTHFELGLPSDEVHDFGHEQFRQQYEIDSHVFWLYTLFISVRVAQLKEDVPVIYNWAAKFMNMAAEHLQGDRFEGLPGE